MASSHSTSPLELLHPETQSLILCRISTAKTLHSLISASPRFYQVFDSRREYHLTQLAKQQCGYSRCAWNAVVASELPKPLSVLAADDFIEKFNDDDGWEANIMPLDVSISMIRLGSCVDWLISDFARNSLLNLTHLKSLAGLKQNDLVLQSGLSEVETSRIRRAFFRFESLRHICKRKSGDLTRWEMIRQNCIFLFKYNLDEIEEIACVRDYIIRRLWVIFDQMEDDLVQGAQAGLVPKALQAMQLLPDAENWFGVRGKSHHRFFMEHMMFRGLSFLKDVFTADKARCAELIFMASAETTGFRERLITETLGGIRAMDLSKNTPKVLNPVAHDDHDESFFRDDLDKSGFGLRWINMKQLVYRDRHYARKGPRDWGFVFWSRERLRASGILDM